MAYNLGGSGSDPTPGWAVGHRTTWLLCASNSTRTLPASSSATAYLGLGSNLGDRAAVLRAALTALDDHPRICVDFDAGLGSLYESSPVGVPSSQPAYLNSAVRVRTTLDPAGLLSQVLSIEAGLGRTRRQRWEARTIDIDLLLYDDLVVDDESLSLPHPRMHRRRFVLEPLAEIAGDLLHPRLRVSIASLARKIRLASPDDSVVRVAGPNWPGYRRGGVRVHPAPPTIS